MEGAVRNWIGWRLPACQFLPLRASRARVKRKSRSDAAIALIRRNIRASSTLAAQRTAFTHDDCMNV
jgi:hypothetical protein